MADGSGGESGGDGRGNGRGIMGWMGGWVKQTVVRRTDERTRGTVVSYIYIHHRAAGPGGRAPDDDRAT